MPFRQWLYWPHMICGVIAGLVIFLMSVTGVLLTYERQIVAWAESEYNKPVLDGAEPLAIERLIDMAENANESPPSLIMISADPEAPVGVRTKDRTRLYMNAYTGEMLGFGPVEMREFFSYVTRLHRWFALEGDARGTGRMITGASNLMFLFIAVSGLYLWFPRVFKWQNFRTVIFFQKNKSSRARDFNWHHVMGIWSFIPLIVIIATASVFYYKWANDLVYDVADVFADETAENIKPVKHLPVAKDTDLQSLLDTAVEYQSGWNRLTFQLPKSDEKTIRFTYDFGTGGEPQKKESLTFDLATGKATKLKTFDDNSAGRQARIFIRFLHTGESLGVWGQTIAGLVSLFAAIMVYTGLALSWRKYISPILARKRG